MSLRSLQRKLLEEGTSYARLLEETRRDMAKNYIENSILSINEIAYLLGFSEPANFTRAFRRWYDVTPSSYRGTIQKTAFS
jgi:AraC-like DNA-binding protein